MEVLSKPDETEEGVDLLKTGAIRKHTDAYTDEHTDGHTHKETLWLSRAKHKSSPVLFVAR